MGKTSVNLAPGMTAFPPLSNRDDKKKRGVVTRNQMLRTLQLRQLGKSKSKSKSKKSPELDPVNLGMDDLCRLYEDTPITPMLDKTSKPPHNQKFVIYFDVEQVARLGELKRNVLSVGYPLGDIKDVAAEIRSISYSGSTQHTQDPVAVRELHAARARICWAMKFGGMHRQENLLDVKDQETAKSLDLWEETNPWSVVWSTDFFED